MLAPEHAVERVRQAGLLTDQDVPLPIVGTTGVMVTVLCPAPRSAERFYVDEAFCVYRMPAAVVTPHGFEAVFPSDESRQPFRIDVRE